MCLLLSRYVCTGLEVGFGLIGLWDVVDQGYVDASVYGWTVPMRAYLA